MIAHIDKILKHISDQYHQSYVFIDSAGIGDSCYTRLLIQSLISTGVSECEILHIVPELVAPLYRDDNLVTVVSGYDVAYRIVTEPICIETYNEIDKMVNGYFIDRKIYHMGKLLCDVWPRKHPKNTLVQTWSLASEITLNHLVGYLTHRGKCQFVFNKPHMVLEYCSISFNYNVSIDIFNKIIEKYSNDYEVCWVGSKTDPQLKGGVDCRGLNLYDTFSLLKSSALLVHTGSGIYTMCNVFLPKLKSVMFDLAL